MMFGTKTSNKVCFLKHDHPLEKMFEETEGKIESKVLDISITNSSFKTNNSELVREIGEKMKLS